MKRDARIEGYKKSWHIGCQVFSHRYSPWRLWHLVWQHWHGWQTKRIAARPAPLPQNSEDRDA